VGWLIDDVEEGAARRVVAEPGLRTSAMPGDNKAKASAAMTVWLPTALVAFGLAVFAQVAVPRAQTVGYSSNWHCGHERAPRAFAQVLVGARVCEVGTMSKNATLSAFVGVLVEEQFFESLEEEWGCTASIARLMVREAEHWARDQKAYCRDVDRVARELPVYGALRRKRLVR
jgi:hypothetical protein